MNRSSRKPLGFLTRHRMAASLGVEWQSQRATCHRALFLRRRLQRKVGAKDEESFVAEEEKAAVKEFGLLSKLPGSRSLRLRQPRRVLAALLLAPPWARRKGEAALLLTPLPLTWLRRRQYVQWCKEAIRRRAKQRHTHGRRQSLAFRISHHLRRHRSRCQVHRGGRGRQDQDRRSQVL